MKAENKAFLEFVMSNHARRKQSQVDFAQPIKIDFSLKPAEAIAYFQAKGFTFGFSWQDVLAEEHTKAFTVAKGMKIDILKDIRQALDEAISEGLTAEWFIENLQPILEKNGWWGRKEVVDPLTGNLVEAQLGSSRRLELIFRTNMQTSYAVGHWQQIQETKNERPWLLYDAVEDDRTRERHKQWDGLVLPVDHKFWKTHYPPNGYNCRCSVIQLSDEELHEYGLQPSRDPKIKTRRWTSYRTGKTRRVPESITPGFDYNVGQAHMKHLNQVMREKIADLPKDMQKHAKKMIKKKPE